MRRDSERTFHALDAMRGIAAIAVAMRHFAPLWVPAFVLTSSYLAVDFFFLLSGYVLAHAYDRRFAAGMSAFEFLKIRLIRLYPLYLLGCSIAIVRIFIIFALHVPTSWTPKSLVVASLFNGLFLPTPNRLAPDCGFFALLVPAWSLSLELFVNILFALFWKQLSKGVLIAICVLAAGAVVWSSVYYGSLDSGWRPILLAGGFARVLFAFPLGVLLYRYSKRFLLPRVSPWLLFAALVLLFWVPATGAAREVYDVAAVSVAFPAILLAGARSESSVWQTRVFLFFGAISYAIYVLHQPVGDLVLTLTTFSQRVDLARLAPYSGLSLLFLTLTLSVLADRFFDLPVRRKLSALGTVRGHASVLRAE